MQTFIKKCKHIGSSQEQIHHCNRLSSHVSKHIKLLINWGNEENINFIY